MNVAFGFSAPVSWRSPSSSFTEALKRPVATRSFRQVRCTMAPDSATSSNASMSMTGASPGFGASTTGSNVAELLSDEEAHLALMDSVRQRTSQSHDTHLAIVVLGASGDLAKKKTFPAIFSLYYHGLLPEDFCLYGFARKEMTNESFRELIITTLSCRVIDGEKCAAKMDEFLPRCFYHRGDYSVADTFSALDDTLKTGFEKGVNSSNRLFYLAVPPSVFNASCSNINSAARAGTGWTRVVVEKPFGRDSASYNVLREQLAVLLHEREIFRIDHFLAKELVQNLMTLRFANTIFEPLWNRNHIKSVQITFKENFGVEGRAGYFDDIGIIRDIMQNHLLQILALLVMEPPVSLCAEDIRDEKVKVLRSMSPLTADDFALGQYGARDAKSKAYLDDDGVPASSRTPTFAACAMHINNARWDGVPILMRAGKALDERKTEIRIQFKPVPGALFPTIDGAESNELVMRVQPDEAIFVRIVSKVPGLTSRMEEARLNLFYRHAWEESKDIPDAYERLILDVIQGEKSLFIRDDELEVAWNIFTPALEQLEGDDIPKPEIYEYGGKGPRESEYLAAKYGIQWSD